MYWKKFTNFSLYVLHIYWLNCIGHNEGFVFVVVFKIFIRTLKSGLSKNVFKYFQLNDAADRSGRAV
jgi:hypothetical protein